MTEILEEKVLWRNASRCLLVASAISSARRAGKDTSSDSEMKPKKAVAVFMSHFEWNAKIAHSKNLMSFESVRCGIIPMPRGRRARISRTWRSLREHACE